MPALLLSHKSKQKPMVFRVGKLAGEGGSPGRALLPEGPGQAAGEEAQQAQGQ